MSSGFVMCAMGVYSHGIIITFCEVEYGGDRAQQEARTGKAGQRWDERWQIGRGKEDGKWMAQNQ